MMTRSLALKFIHLKPAIFVLSISLLIGCASVQRQFSAPPVELYETAQIYGFKDIRFWGDKQAPYLEDSIERLQRSIRNRPASWKRFHLLALSGGAEDGAYGAGFLKGWSARGDRPEFFMVTGVSTGALIAPFAFLGPDYDGAIKRLFTESSRKDIFYLTPIRAIFGGTALGDTAPLRRTIEREVNDAMVRAIARESRKGRLLQIATTNLIAQRPVSGKLAELQNPVTLKRNN